VDLCAYYMLAIFRWSAPNGPNGPSRGCAEAAILQRDAVTPSKIAAALLVVRKARHMASQVFTTRWGIVTLTDLALVYDQRRRGKRGDSVKRSEIIGMSHMVRVRGFFGLGSLAEVQIRYRGGSLTIPTVPTKTAEAIRVALGF
jgi:hypothetical protein